MRLHINFSVVLPVYARVALELQRRYNVTDLSGFVYGRDSLRDLERIPFPLDKIRVHTDALREFGGRKLDMGYLRSREEAYGDPHIYPMIAGDRVLREYDHLDALRVLEASLRLAESMFDAFRPDAVISDGVACVMSYAQYVVARAREIPFLTIAPARVNGRFYIIRNHMDRYERVDELFVQYQVQGLGEQNRARAEAFIQNFRESATKPDYFVKFATVPSVDRESLRILGDLVHRRYFLDRNSYLLASPFAAIRNRLIRIVKARVLDRPHFENPVLGEKFVFFPLHFQPELSTLIVAPYTVNQIAVIENLAKTLPIDHILYVKEHKASLGRRPLGYYNAIRSIPNVRLISPYVDSHDLIKRSSAVCVISSTVGWEAILYEKPVITLGEVCYNAFDLVKRVQAMDDAPAAIRWAIDEHRPDHDLLVKYVAALMNGTYEGDVYHHPGATTSPSLEPENIARIAAAVAGELELKAEPPGHLGGAIPSPAFRARG
jgi:hypothetical protein